MRGRKFWRWRAEILHTWFSHPTAPFFHLMFSKIEKSWFSIHPIIYYWGAYYILLVRLRLFFTPTGLAISFTPLRPVATEPYKLNCTPTALRPRATAIFGVEFHSDRSRPPFLEQKITPTGGRRVWHTLQTGPFSGHNFSRIRGANGWLPWCRKKKPFG